MAKTIKDTDYLVISARVKALETGLLTAERMEQILDAKSGEDAGKLLQEWGYPQLDPRRPEAMDAALSAVREATLADLAEGTPDARYIDLFKVKYDYHNVKALLKAEAVGTAPDRMLMDMGRVSTAELAEAVRSRELDGLPETLAAAVVEARETIRELAKSGDCGIIYLTEQLAKDLPDVLDRYKDELRPAIILIPGREGSLGIGMNNIQQSIQRAVGADIL